MSLFVLPAKTEGVEPAWVGEVMRFWFEELGDAHWFARSDAIDAQIRDRFLQLHEQVVEREDLEVSAPRSILAAVIVLDQFSRNLFRSDARAFAADPIARRLSRSAIAQGFETQLKDRREKYFLYLPFEHSEDRKDQALANAMIRQLGNDALKRPSTPDEIAFLKEPASLF